MRGDVALSDNRDGEFKYMFDHAVVLIFLSVLPFLALTPAAMVAILAILSFASLALVMATLEGWMGICEGAPLALGLVSLSM